MFNDENDKQKKNITLLILFAFFILSIIIYIFVLYNLQIVKGTLYKNQSQQNARATTIIPAQRGEIFDRNANLPMVINSDSFAVLVTPGEIPKDRYDTVILKLSQYLGITKSDIDRIIPKDVRKSYTSIQVKSNVPFDVISNIAENLTELPGVSWASKPIRNYLHTGSLSHIVGYVGDITPEEVTMLYNQGYTNTSIVGKTGIERQYDSLLQGKPGKEMSTVDVHGKVISNTPEFIPPEMGKNLVLTIDSRIQKLAEDALGDRVGAVVVLRPSDGEILAMVSYPYFDSNIFNSDDGNKQYAKLVKDESKPLINRAVQLSYPPASTFKVIMSAALLQEKTFPESKKIECKGELVYGGNTFHCHLKEGHNWLDLKNGLAQSCNVYYWTIGRDYLGIDKISSYAREFGFGQSTQIDLPSQVNGRFPTAEWKEKTYHQKWMGGDTMSCSIGQGYIEATPLQLADMVAMVSNEGTIYKPHLLKEVRDPSTNEVIMASKPEILTQSTIDNSVWKTLQEDMRYVTTDGTPKYVMSNKTVQIACKTGTAEVNGYKDSWHSWLVSYAPYDAPPEDRICVVTIVEACNQWEWWAPYCTNIILQGIFANQDFDEAVNELGFRWVVEQHKKKIKSNISRQE